MLKNFVLYIFRLNLGHIYKMLTFRVTNLIIASEINSQTFNIKKEIFFTEERENPEYKHKHDENTGRYTCGYCNKTYIRKDNYVRHLES